MLILRFFWAGQLVFRRTVDPEQLEETLEEVASELALQSVTHVTNGKVFTIDTLCVDVYEGEKLIALKQVSA